MAEAYLMKGDFANARKYMIPTMVKHGGFSPEKLRHISIRKAETAGTILYSKPINVNVMLKWCMNAMTAIGLFCDGECVRVAVSVTGLCNESGFVIPELVDTITWYTYLVTDRSMNF